MKIGNLNFKLEEICLDIWSKYPNIDNKNIIGLFYNELQQYPNNQETFLDNSHPVLKIKLDNISWDSKIKKKVSNLTKQYINQEMQWGEILFTVFGYLSIHHEQNFHLRYK